MDEITFELSTNTKQRNLLRWAMDCAYHVLTFYEEEYPNDKRPRAAIEAGGKWLNNEITVSEARSLAFKAHAAAREAKIEQAKFVARSAGHTAATVHVKTHAVHAANYALRVFDYSEKEKEKERIWQYERLLKITKKTID